MAGAAVAAALAYRTVRGRREAGPDSAEVAELRKNLLTAEAVIKAEPQALVFWDQGQGVRVMVHTLSSVAGLPQDPADLLKIWQMARPGVRPGAQARPRRPVRGWPPLQLAPQDGGGRPRRGRRAGGGGPRHPAPARYRRPQARSCSRARPAPAAGARHARGAHPPQCPADAGLVPRCGRTHPVGQRGLCAGRRDGERGRGARAPDRALGDAPARGGRRGARQGHTLPRAGAPDQRRHAQGPRCRGHSARGGKRRRGHRRGGSRDGAGRAGPARGSLRAHARPGGDRRRHLRPRPETHLLQRGLSQTVAARCRLARNQALGRRAARPPARALPPAGGRQLPRLEGKDSLRLQDGKRVRGLVAPARRPHHPCRLGPTPRRRPHLSLRRRHRAYCARKPLQCADRRAARDPRQPEGGCGRLRHRRPPQALQLGVPADLAALAQQSQGRAAHRQDHRPGVRASTTIWPPGRA